MKYKHFTGCASFEEVKKKYKTLALSLHPDRNGGDRLPFQDLLNEYHAITKKPNEHSFPLGNSPDTNQPFSGFYEWKKQYENQQSSGFSGGGTQGGRDSNQQSSNFDDFYTQEKKKRQETPDEKWTRKMQSDETFGTIQSVFAEAALTNRSSHWMLMEVFKIADLGLEHFKFLAWLVNSGSNNFTNLTDEWAADAYRKYRDCENIKWPYR